MYFLEEDKKIIENLRYNKKLKPGFDLIKYCLMWDDELAFLSEDGMTKLWNLFIARFFIFHSGIPEEKWWVINKERYKIAWQKALDSNVKWPGFEKKRLYLSKTDKKYLNKEIEYLKSNPDDY